MSDLLGNIRETLPPTDRQKLKDSSTTLQPRVLDIFCGAGGLSLGFENAGFDIHTAVDNWGDALETIRRNKPSTLAQMNDLGDELAVKDLCQNLPQIEVVIGGPPCQGFSIAGKRDPEDPRNKLYKGFVRSIELLKPKMFLMENVPTIASPKNIDLFQDILSDFANIGYETKHSVLTASNFGVPQNRKRMFVVGVRKDLKIEFEFPTPSTKLVSALDGIGDLPEDSVPDGGSYPYAPQSDFQKLMRRNSANLYNHQTTSHSAQTIRIISTVPDGGNHKDLPQEMRGIRNVNIAWTRFASGKPSPTIDTGHRHHFHYLFNRVPTARESARLQSFPDDYIFVGSKTSQLKQIGNAVPPLMAQALGERFMISLAEGR